MASMAARSHGQRRIHIRRVPDRARAHRAHAGELLRFFRAVDMVLDAAAARPMSQAMLEVLPIAGRSRQSRVKPGFLPARNLRP